MKSIFLTLKKWWMAFAHALGWVNTRVILSVVYIVIFGIGAMVMFVLRKDPLRRKFTKQQSYWMDKEPIAHTPEHAKRQF